MFRNWGDLFTDLRIAAEFIKVDPATGLKVLPHWLAQPYFRPQPTAETNTTILTQGDGVAAAGMALGILLLTLHSCSTLGELLVAKPSAKHGSGR